ncbi:calcium/sodium antiporter [Reichenbachiella agarivorans]|uniref:Calcium/sodium antiporter n=1 Tax=Reichenbachiella agarivorans TaxID=2979464 RepID=A0ABY6CLJ1_9BACT|nr:calcium/sodium antiporter [Reichenbachiella agarivorans]UXP31383.1 calcium/sodium antiporter [Reichenbachiella agarivorans]
MVIPLLLITVGFVLLIKGADYLVNGASSLAKRYNVSDIAIGLTVVAMGTSAPELVVNLISGSGGHNDVVFGNIIGSNIFNTYLILGISSVIYPLTVQKNALWKEVPYSLVATVVLFILVNDQLIFGAEQNEASVLDGIILLIMFLGFLYYVFQNMKRTGDTGGDMDEIEMHSTLKTTLMIIFGLAGLTFGGQMIVDNSIIIAHHFGWSEKLIGLTILAAGTSLPELATTAVAAFHKKSDLAVGNIVGSNIFNILLVLGATAVFHAPLSFDIDLNIDLYIVMIGSFMLFLFMFTLQKYKLDRAEGLLYLIGFGCYITFLYFNRM